LHRNTNPLYKITDDRAIMEVDAAEESASIQSMDKIRSGKIEQGDDYYSEELKIRDSKSQKSSNSVKSRKD